MKKLLVTRKSACLQPIRELIEKQKHMTLVLWTIECAKSVLPIFEEKYPNDKRPREAVEAAKAWAYGEIKMPVAKKAAHATHNAATAVSKENPSACAAARAMGHVIGTIHVETHAMGFVMYSITAFIYASEQKNADEIIAEKSSWLYERLLYWEANIDKVETSWASFLLKDTVPNKEALLRKRIEQKQ
ncbi:MAG TPA: Imm5 family immunity protein [candidate division Zixibacteria bacterium]|nr:Imm5 family immunity protein [candidate division Zixibacteria bacterium]